MTELQLYKFIHTDNSIESRWQMNGNKDDVLIFPRLCQLEDFCAMIESYLSDNHIKAHLRAGYAAIWMNDLCDYYDIEIENVFDKKAAL